MNCRDCQTKMCDLTVDLLSTPEAAAMREHFAACPECEAEMVVLERTLFSVSTLRQPLPSPLASEQMWHHCSEHIFQKVEAARVPSAQPPSAQPEYSIGRSWFARQPKWSWATLGGALAILASAWFMSPREDAGILVPQDNFAARSFPAQNDSPGELISLKRPSGAASVLVNHHSAMSVDPFTDYVGTTLVSYSATMPETSASR